MATIKVLVELGADINLENLQGYTPVTILVSSNTQHCYEALKFFVMRGARIPAYIRNPITPLNSAQLYALHVVNESRQVSFQDNINPAVAQAQQQQQLLLQQQQQWQNNRRHSRQKLSYQNQNVYQERSGRRVERMISQGRPLIHVVAAMQEDYWILDCLCEAGLDPAMTFGGETALVAAAAHLRIKNVEWLLNNDLDVSSEAGVQRAIRVVKLLHQQGTMGRGGHGRSASASAVAVLNGEGGSRGSNEYRLPYSSASKEYLENISDLGKYSWAGVAYGEADRISKDMVKPVLSLLEQWTGSRRIQNRKEVATKLKVMYGTTMDPFAVSQGGAPMASSVSLASTNSASSAGSQGHPYPYQFQHQYHQQQQPVQQQQNRMSMQRSSSPGGTLRGATLQGSKSLRKNQRHLIDQALSERPGRFW
jgi:hypothetical protein